MMILDMMSNYMKMIETDIILLCSQQNLYHEQDGDFGEK
jgi:hypothetical protein